MIRFNVLCVAAAYLAALAGPVRAQTDNQASPAPPPVILPSMTVIGNTPLPGSGVYVDKVPANVQILGAGRLWRDGEDDLLPNAAQRTLSSVNLNSEQGTPFQSNFNYRGFEASPISGIPQGIAVYQNGVRINEAFGDMVNWELVPQFAVSRMTIQSNNPVFGLNALGGAVSLEMKNGFNFHGTDVQASGGSFGNFGGFAESGRQVGNFGLYGAIGGVHDDGFRNLSRSGLTQGYFDLGWEKDNFTVHLSISAADSSLGATGPTPIEMLEANRKTSFTFPQIIENQAQLIQLTTTYKPTDTILLSGDVYYRHFHQNLVDGNTTDVAPCTNNAAFFCLEGGNLFPNDVLFDRHGNPVSTSAVPLPPGASYGETDFTQTDTNTIGAGLQAKFTGPLWGRGNNFVVGATFDHSVSNFSAFGELGAILPDLKVTGSGVIIDQGLSPTASPPIEQPVNALGANTYYGVYATDTFDVTPRLAMTLGGRLNVANVSIADRSGAAPALNGSHNYIHFNPGVGLTYKLTDNVTLYGGWSESNRAPTPAELTCSNPTMPCILDAFLVADPNLKQVVSQTFEFGARGHFVADAVPGMFLWNVGAFRTDSENDILLLATDINGFGFFSNVGTTRRQGVEAGLAWRWEKWLISANYTFLDATFLENLTLSSNSPAADPGGKIFVQPGDRIPMNPAHRIVLNIEYDVTPQWKVGGDARYISGQYLVGDESNQVPKMPGYVTVNLHASYRIHDRITLFGEIDNVFDKQHFTYGTFTQLDGLPARFSGLSDPRTFSPAPGRAFYGGVKVSF
ncbi:MAG: TonB-dependent receptor [Stellaceae bacterium]